MSIELTKIQQRVVEARGKNILVAAGAGTGKTRVLVERFISLLRDDGFLVEEILALTFTEKAANEMKSRLQTRLEELGMEKERRELERAYISTIHAFASRLLREHPLEAGIDPEFRVIENEEVQFLKDDVLSQCIDKLCVPDSPVFNLLRVYGEASARDGVYKIYNTARNQGVTLNAFFEMTRAGLITEMEPLVIHEIKDLFEQVGESAYAAEWGAFAANKAWDWNTVDDYKDWQGQFSRKRGKKGDDSWARIKAGCKDMLGVRLNGFLSQWMNAFEQLACEFESAYSRAKAEAGVLDFDDLQMKILRLFESTSAVNQKLLKRYRIQFRQIMIDEYQDTDYLQDALIGLLSDGDNLFFVGDYKQSIYGFRGAEPQLFLAKQAAYADGKDGVNIELSENFRTAPETLNILNEFFQNLWQEDTFNFTRLFAGISDQDGAGVEVMPLKVSKSDTMDIARLREADQIAAKIQQLHRDGTSYGDMAVLFEAMTHAGIYEQALKKHNIPYYAVSSRGFYHQSEIKDMVSFLSFLDNPLSDIALAASLRSPLFQIRDDTLFRLAETVKYGENSGAKSKPLFDSLHEFDRLESITAQQKAGLERFRDIVTRLLALKDRLTLSEFIDLILKETSGELILLADTYGVRKYANLKKLIALAREFESHGPLSLNGFLRTLRRLESQEVRESEAQVEAEASGQVVRLLTIHRSKGLEFPVVFMADLGHRRQAHEAKTFLSEVNRGYAMKLYHPKTGKSETPQCWECLNDLQNEKDAQEWKRLFYVAATRVEKKLIFSGVYEEDTKLKDSFHEMNTWMKWIMSTSLADLEIEPPVLTKPQASREQETGRKSFSLSELPSFKSDDEFIQTIAEQVAAREARPARVIDLPVSAYAAYQKDKARYWSAYEIGLPEFFENTDMKDARVDPEQIDWADFGTRMHLVLERMDFKNVSSASVEELTAYCFKNTPAPWLPEALKIVRQFLKTKIFSEIKNARRVYRELPFILNQRHGVIHGIIDLLIQDSSGSWQVIDYKTAEGSDEKVETSGYLAQLKLYGHAIHKIMGVYPAKGILYFLKNDWSYTSEWHEKDFEGIEQWTSAMQEEILKYRPE